LFCDIRYPSTQPIVDFMVRSVDSGSSSMYAASVVCQKFCA
jgi:hypothetical protein